MYWSLLAVVLAAFAMLGQTLADTIVDDIRSYNRASTIDEALHWVSVSAPKHLILGEKDVSDDELELVPRDATGSSSLHDGPAPAKEGFDGHTAEAQTHIDGERCQQTCYASLFACSQIV